MSLTWSQCGEEGRGGGVGMSMDGVDFDTSDLGRGGRSIRRVGGLVNGATSDACGGEWVDVNHSIERPSGSEWGMLISLLKHELVKNYDG